MKNFNEKSTMYKLMFVLAMIFVATFNIACSSSDDDDESGSGKNLPRWAKAYDLDQFEDYGGVLVCVAQNVPVDISSQICYIGNNSYSIEQHTRWYCKVSKDKYIFSANTHYFFYRNGHLHMLLQYESELNYLYVGPLKEVFKLNYRDNARTNSGGSSGGSNAGNSSIYEFYKSCLVCKLTEVSHKTTDKEFCTMEVYKSTINGSYYLKTGRNKYISLTRRKYSTNDEVGPEYNYFCINVASVGSVNYWYYVKI